MSYPATLTSTASAGASRASSTGSGRAHALQPRERFLRRHASVEVLGQDLTPFRVAQLASHNSQFDGPFLTSWFDRLGIFLPASYRVFCTLQRAYWLFQEHPELTSPDDFRLATLCKYFAVPISPADAHEAMADARAAIAVYRAILQAEKDLVSFAARCSQGSKSTCTPC